MGGGPPGAPGARDGGYVSVREIIVTAPLRASSLPPIDTPALVVIEVKARIFPRKEVLAPMVAELPTCQRYSLLGRRSPPAPRWRLPW